MAASVRQSDDIIMEAAEGAGDKIKQFLSALQKNQIQCDQKIRKLEANTKYFTSMNVIAMIIGLLAFFAVPLYWSFTEIKHLNETIKELKSDLNGNNDECDLNLLPKGVIVAWQSEDIPVGWILCDGNNGTPDLRNRFIYGWNKENNKLLQTGGKNQQKLKIDNIPSHGHIMNELNIKGNENYYQDEGCNTIINLKEKKWNNKNCVKEYLVINTNKTGGDKAFNTIPRYMVLAYIMKL